MKSYLESLLIALSMYSTLPVKCLNWNAKNLRHAMLFFPIVGLLCGGALWLVWTGCQLLDCSAFLFAVLAALVNVLITGGIHLDGFCDTADALYSRRPMEEKLRILKDPNCGPFAVFSVVLILLVQVAAYAQIYTTQTRWAVGLLAGGFWIARCLSGISVTRFPCTTTSSLAKTFGEHAGKYVGTGLMILTGLAMVVLVIFYQWMAVVSIFLSLLVFLGYYHMQKKQFGGVTGDLAGFFLVICETIWLLSYAMLGDVL
ncbi:MAG: adenosylcobinamide-GDP ribazoletransferase [Oscillospiraceae bacterium]|nr:adenosylcobinamide-GDP ribazoletransferase [Oscillospiraceae bacterium]